MGSLGHTDNAVSYDTTVDTYQLILYSDDQSPVGFAFPGKLAGLHLQVGQPGWATFNIPITTLPHQDLEVDGRTAFDPNTTPKPESRVTINCVRGGTAFPIMTGTVMERIHDVASDSVTLKILDDLYQLTKFSNMGQYTVNVDGALYYNSSKPCVFNLEGWPDCLDTDYGPVFAPEPRYGWVPTDTTEPAPGAATTRARSWRVSDVITYLANVFSEEIGGFFDVGLTPVDDLKPSPIPGDWIQFTPDIGEQVELPANAFAANSATETARRARVVHNYNAENKSVLQILNDICERAGPFAPYCTAGAGTNKINILYIGQGFERTEYDLDTTFKSVQSGTVKESTEKWYGFSTIVGAAPLIERQVSTDCGTITPTIDSGSASVSAVDRQGAAMGNTTDLRTGSLIPAWSAADEANFITFVSANSTAGGGLLTVQEAFRQATKLFPLVFCAYRVNGDFDILSGTKYSSLTGQLNGFSPQLNPFLVSGIKALYDTSQATGLGQWLPFDITIECLVDPNDPNSTTSPGATSNVWKNALRSDGLALSPDATYFMVPALRDSFDHPTFRGNVADGASSTDIAAIKANHVRATVAIKVPFRIYATDATDPNGVGGRVTPAIRPQYLAASDSEYIEWLRVSSYPWGKHTSTFDSTTSSAFGVNGTGKLPDRCTEDSELFTDKDRVTAHSQARNRRNNWIYSGGSLVYKNYEPAINLGARIASISDLEIGGVVTDVMFDEDSQSVTVGFG